DTEFEGSFALYGNSKFVFLVLLPVVLALALVAAYVWPVPYRELASLPSITRPATVSHLEFAASQIK
ncbi:hypothetical protein H6B10_17680, partial [Gemmiger formicilis]|uniref:hypothetical protein n=1 Tax=Gemmiger formicilis TaxID=745368 RepID=UPI00195CAE57